MLPVADTGPIIHLGEIDALSLLSIPDELLIPEVVMAELDSGGRPSELSAVAYSLVETDPDATGEIDLDPGESAVLATARERDAVVLTDDLAARESAIRMDLAVHGSVGVVALGYFRGDLDRDEAASLMHRLQHETSLFVAEAVVERGIARLDEGR